MDNTETLATLRKRQEWTIQKHWQRWTQDKNGQYRNTGNIEQKTRMDNTETLATLSTRQEWTIQKHWQHWAQDKNGQYRNTGNIEHKTRMDNTETLATLSTRHTTKTKKNATKKMSNTDPTKTLEWTQVLAKGKQFWLLTILVISMVYIL
jgi:hypothetical protein